jgi:anti-sigma B factor antagonist
MTNFKVSARQVGSATVIDITGPLMYGEARALHDMLCELIETGQTKILLNLGNVSHLDSSGISLLVRSYATVKNAGGQLKVLNLSKQIQRLLEVTNLANIFEDYSDEETALRSFH